MNIRIKNVMRKNFRFLIKSEFREKLFACAIKREGTINALAKKLKCNRDSVRNMRNSRTKFISFEIVKKLLNMVEISYESLEANVSAIKGGKSGRITYVNFPIKGSKELALLVAKGMGDGSIERNFRFSYWNKQKSLINEFCYCVNKSLGKTKITVNELENKLIQAKCNSFIGLIVHLAGVPIGNKTLQGFDVPKWIKKGSKEVKVSFIRGLFDDESCVYFNKKYRTKRIIFAQAKWIKQLKSLRHFLASIKKILLEFGIKTTKIRKQMSFVDKNGREKIVLSFAISRRKSLEKFSRKINFINSKKRLKLEKLFYKVS